MPEALVSILPALITVGATGVTTGLEASGVIGGSSGPSVQSQELANQEQQQKQQQQQEQQLFKQYAPNAQAQTGGSLSDTSLSALISQLSGAPQDINLAQQTVFGNNGLASGGG